MWYLGGEPGELEHQDQPELCHSVPGPPRIRLPRDQKIKFKNFTSEVLHCDEKYIEVPI